MARFVLCPYGSAGDINPFVALAIVLRHRGHDVLFAVEDTFRPMLTTVGFDVHVLPGDSATMLAPYAREMTNGADPTTAIKLLVNKRLLPTLHPTVTSLLEACAGADMLVNTVLQFAASFVADMTGIRWASVALTPLNVPAASIESYALPAWLPNALRPLANRGIWAVGRSIYRKLADAPINEIRAEYGLPARRDLLFTGNLSSQLTSVAVSPTFMPPAREWPSSVRMTGFCFWDTPGNWTEPAELTDFLNTPQPVVAVSSGSSAAMAVDVFTSFYQTSIDAILHNGGHALIIGAAPDSLPEPLPGNVLAVPFAPFSYVYPRCATVIHHGGIGTTAQALRAGVPMLIVPWGADQFFTGAQIARISAGRTVLRSDYTPLHAHAAIQALLHDTTYHQHAQAISARLMLEDGATALADALESLL